MLSGIYTATIEFVSESNFLTIAMLTDVSNTARGFEAQYSGKDCYYYGLCSTYQRKFLFYSKLFVKQ